jgi:chromate transport protein ChrA
VVITLGEFFGIAAGIVGIMGYAPYVRDILKRTTRPDRIAWSIWLFEYTALFFAQISAGALNSLWLIGLQLVGVAIIFSLSLRYGIGAFTHQAKLLLGCVFVALFIWHSTQNTALAIIILVSVEAFGVVLTMIKTYKEPGSETLSFWAFVGVAGALGIPAVGFGAQSILYVYPVSLIVMSGGVIGASLLGARKPLETSASELE